jgi:hypothetical protein
VQYNERIFRKSMSWEEETRILCLKHFVLESHGLPDVVRGATVPALLRRASISQLVYSSCKWGEGGDSKLL